LRLSIGGGGLATDLDYDAPGLNTTRVRGGTVGLDLLIGGSPTPGLAIGGGLMINGAGDAEVTTDTNVGGVESIETTQQDAGFSVFGVFFDAFPNPEGGFHVGGMIGLSTFDLNDNDDTVNEQRESNGWGGAAWVGFGGFVSSQWSLGGVLRLSGGVSNSDVVIGLPNGETRESREQAKSRALTILFTALLH
jgi:hypothetical protein